MTHTCSTQLEVLCVMCFEEGGGGIFTIFEELGLKLLAFLFISFALDSTTTVQSTSSDTINYYHNND